jgi:hypothetical protein
MVEAVYMSSVSKEMFIIKIVNCAPTTGDLRGLKNRIKQRAAKNGHPSFIVKP